MQTSTSQEAGHLCTSYGTDWMQGIMWTCLSLKMNLFIAGDECVFCGGDDLFLKMNTFGAAWRQMLLAPETNVFGTGSEQFTHLLLKMKPFTCSAIKKNASLKTIVSCQQTRCSHMYSVVWACIAWLFAPCLEYVLKTKEVFERDRFVYWETAGGCSSLVIAHTQPLTRRRGSLIAEQ